MSVTKHSTGKLRQMTEWVQVFSGEENDRQLNLLGKITHHCGIVETGNVTCRFKH